MADILSSSSGSQQGSDLSLKFLSRKTRFKFADDTVTVSLLRGMTQDQYQCWMILLNDVIIPFWNWVYKEAIHAYFNNIQGEALGCDKSYKCLRVLIDKRLSFKNIDVVCKNITAVTVWLRIGLWCAAINVESKVESVHSPCCFICFCIYLVW